jgi:GAF domain-containing protein
LSLIDESRQWIKSCVGLDLQETARDISFCGHVVFERRPMIVADATRDARFAGNPLVTGTPHIRAYMGIPLFTLDGQPIGTLCAIDVQTREFRSLEIETLTKFARIVEETIHARELAAQTAALLRATIQQANQS